MAVRPVTAVCGLILALGVPLLIACPSFVGDLCENRRCEVQSDAGSACDPSADPTCVSEATGVYVDGNAGSDSNDGREKSPTKTIRVALSQAAAAGKSRVYVCDAVYPEKVVVTTAVTLLGGLDCATWKYTGKRARIAPPAGGGAALEIRAPDKLVSVLDIDVAGAPGVDFAADNSINSIGVFVPAAAQVTLQRMAITANTGGKGANAGPPITNLRGDVGARAGNPAAGVDGGAEKPCPCGQGGSVGGRGGNANQNGGSGSTTLSDGGVVTAGNGGVGGGGADCFGGSGPNGAAGTVPVQAELGVVSADGWTPARGATGAVGQAGMGGGGGGGRSGTMGGGGGGGCAGCGGAGGLPGAGGGASLAVVVGDAGVTVVHATLSASAAGNGGDGSAGESGGGGGSGAIGACGGGAGGNGAGGQGGQGGPGGVSASILYVSRTPTVDDATVVMSTGTAGTGGAGGQGGLGGVSADALVAAPNGIGGATGVPGRAEKIVKL